MRRVKTLPTRKPKAPRRRARVKPLIDRRRLRAAGALFGMAVWGLAAWQVWERGWVEIGSGEATERLIALSASLGFTVEQISVEGRRETSADDLRGALQIDYGAPIFGLDTAGAHERLKKLPWVRAAIIERHLPDTLALRIVERKPIAFWQLDGKFSLIDTEGVAIPIDDIGRFGKLPVVVGAGAPPHAAHLIELLASEPDLAQRVRAAVRIGDRRWDIHLDERVYVMLPEDDPDEAWHRLAELDRTGQLLGRNFSVIDLRLKDRVVVRKAPADEPPANPKQRQS
jgi:cell division protein FtsQ